MPQHGKTLNSPLQRFSVLLTCLHFLHMGKMHQCNGANNYAAEATGALGSRKGISLFIVGVSLIKSMLSPHDCSPCEIHRYHPEHVRRPCFTYLWSGA